MFSLVAIHCPEHGATMTQQPSYTPEQRWCGIWWRCDRCAYSVLFQSAALREQLRQQAQVLNTSERTR